MPSIRSYIQENCKYLDIPNPSRRKILKNSEINLLSDTNKSVKQSQLETTPADLTPPEKTRSDQENNINLMESQSESRANETRPTNFFVLKNREA